MDLKSVIEDMRETAHYLQDSRNKKEREMGLKILYWSLNLAQLEPEKSPCGFGCHPEHCPHGLDKTIP